MEYKSIALDFKFEWNPRKYLNISISASVYMHDEFSIKSTMDKHAMWEGISMYFGLLTVIDYTLFQLNYKFEWYPRKYLIISIYAFVYWHDYFFIKATMDKNDIVSCYFYAFWSIHYNIIWFTAIWVSNPNVIHDYN